jgi:hypothetical protein
LLLWSGCRYDKAIALNSLGFFLIRLYENHIIAIKLSGILKAERRAAKNSEGEYFLRPVFPAFLYLRNPLEEEL